MAASAKLPALAAIEPAPLVFPPAPRILSWIVGTDGDYNWRHIRAETLEKAISIWRDEEGCGSICEAIEEGDTEPCDTCSFCINSGANGWRVAEFDAIEDPTPGDWLRAGYGYTCSRCGDETDPQNDGHAIGDEAVCDYCLTDEERVEIRAQP